MRSPNGSTNSRREGKDQRKYIAHHKKYYMVGGDLFVLIDDVMFKIHSYFFKRDSKGFFDDHPEDASATTPDERGTSEDRAIRILDVSVQEFEHFLWVFYNPLYSIYDADIRIWFSILRLAHRWDFPPVTAFAMRELKRREAEIPLVTRIRLYQDNSAPPAYLVPLYAQLCARETGPTLEEATELGFKDMFNVFRAREVLRSLGGFSPLPEGMTVRDTYSAISDMFGLPEYAEPMGDREAGEDGEDESEDESLANGGSYV